VVNRGVALLLTHKSNEAAADFTRALTLNPAGQAKIYFNRAMAREDAGDLRGAYRDYRQASQIDPKWDRPKQELARFTVGRGAAQPGREAICDERAGRGPYPRRSRRTDTGKRHGARGAENVAGRDCRAKIVHISMRMGLGSGKNSSSPGVPSSHRSIRKVPAV